MATPGMMVLYVENADVSTAFYTKLLDREPAQSSPSFRAFALDGGLTLAVWAREVVQPAPAPATGGDRGAGMGEVVFIVDRPAKVDALCADWQGQGVKIAAAPAEAVFGRTFLALDPDGHRLRVVAPN